MMQADIEYPKHMIQVSTRGFGVGAAYERTYPRDASPFKDFDVIKGNVDLNYAYTIRPQLQLGGFLSNRIEKRSFETKAGETGKVRYYNQLIGVFLTWNFHEDLKSSWYTGMSFSHLNHEEEYAKNVFNFLEDDKNAETYEIYFGKRFSLQRWGISNITYSPYLSFYSQRARKDYDDDGLQDNVALTVMPVKFDVLF